MSQIQQWSVHKPLCSALQAAHIYHDESWVPPPPTSTCLQYSLTHVCNILCRDIFRDVTRFWQIRRWWEGASVFPDGCWSEFDSWAQVHSPTFGNAPPCTLQATGWALKSLEALLQEEKNHGWQNNNKKTSWGKKKNGASECWFWFLNMAKT